MESALLVLSKGRGQQQKQVELEDEGIGMNDSTDEDRAMDVDAQEVDDGATNNAIVEEDTYIPPSEVKAALTLLFEKETRLLSLVYGNTGIQNGADRFFIDVVAVPPNKFRPESRTGASSAVHEAIQNTLLKAILNANISINEIQLDIASDAEPTEGRRKRHLGDLMQACVNLQTAVNGLIDQGKAGTQNAPDGIKQLLEKKEGLFRKNMMGKRVNYAARSVISPDPNIETNEIGVPPVFATKLTYPEPVTEHNIKKLQEAVINGPNKWPGAALIENENGQIISLRNKTLEARQALAYSLLTPTVSGSIGSRNKKVHRHLVNGDIVIMNRQPTLHKPSMMAHKTRVLPGEKTIRMHYVNCNTYNADFDGDEMNMHFPQNELARAEAFQVADTDHQYLSATFGKPLRGLIQDHISVGVALTSRDSFFDRASYQQLLYNCLRPEDGHTTHGRVETLPPAILKPQPLWTGKQLITTILENIRPLECSGLTMQSKSQTNGDRWGKGSEEGRVEFQDSVMLYGILDKKQFGAADNGLVHCVYEAWGHESASRLLSALGRLLTKFLNVRAWSCGIEDLVLSKEGDARRRKQILPTAKIGLDATRKYIGLESSNVGHENHEFIARLEDVLRDDSKQAKLDTVMMSRVSQVTSDVIKNTLPDGLSKPFPYNHMQVMTGSGAKGSDVNASQISCLLGQQSLEGRRVPVMVSGKTLPSFKPFESNPRAGGHIVDRFLTGVRPQEYFFHCMAGREGLIDTAVKTSRSGYLQRCLVKGLEGLKVQYDDTVREADGSLVQFLYGEDGLDVAKQKHLQQFRFIVENRGSYFHQLSLSSTKTIELDAAEYSKQSLKSLRKKGILNAIDPVLAHFSPSAYLGSTSEAFYRAMKDYASMNPDSLLKNKELGIVGLAKRDFEVLMYSKYRASTVEPGEAVGIVAAQSVGEPSTQMTLNTFHLAGHASRNVTLGIPRLREIVMTASDKIATPTMTLHLIPELTDNDCERFVKGISRLSLAQIIEEVEVKECIQRGVGYLVAKVFTIKLKFYPAKEYCAEHGILVDNVLAAIEKLFVPRLTRGIKHEFKVQGSKVDANNGGAVPVVGVVARTAEPRKTGGNDDGDGEDSDAGDGDADDEKRRRDQNEATSYDAPDDDEEEIANKLREADDSDEEMERDEGLGASPEPEGDELDAEMQNLTIEGDDPAGREKRIKAAHSDVQRFKFDYDEGRWCLLRLEVRESCFLLNLC